MRHTFIILFSFIVTCFSGQNLFINQMILPLDTTEKNNIYHYSDIHFGSTHFKLVLPLKFYRGGFITNANKGNLDQLEKTNISGGLIDLNIGGTIYKPNNKHIDGWYVNMNWLQSAAVKYPQGLFNAIMDGNASIDNTINLSATNGHLRNHHKFSFGFLKSKWLYGVTIGSINKEINGELITNSSIYFDSPYEWDITLNGEINSSTPSSNSFSTNGLSLGIDIIHKNQINDKWNYNIGLNNFGAILLNNNNPSYSIDTSFVFSGLNLQEWRNIDSSVANYTSAIDTSYSSNQSTLSPFTLAGNLQFKVNNNLLMYSNIKYTHLSQGNYSVSIGGYKKLNQKILIGSGLNYHTISALQWELFSYYQREKTNIGLRLNNLIGIIPSLGKSFGLQTFISWKL
jgi:hypothetical protein